MMIQNPRECAIAIPSTGNNNIGSKAVADNGIASVTQSNAIINAIAAIAGFLGCRQNHLRRE
jgi:hypothetical protein